MDALQRTTTFVTKGKDPQPALNELVPTLSIPVTRVLQRAMAISAERRYATVAEFWQALHNAAIQPTTELAEEQEVAAQKTLAGASGTLPKSPHEVYTPLLASSEWHRWRIIIPIIVLIALLLGGGIPLTTFLISKHTTSATAIHHVGSKVVNTVVPVVQPELARQYKGTVDDLLTKATTEMTLMQMQQSGQVINGNFSGIERKSTFSGVRDTSKHLFFTVAPSNGQASLFFEGSVRADGNLVGNYCQQDTSGQCVGDYGIWSVAPMNN
jgi:hypothetical protein